MLARCGGVALMAVMCAVLALGCGGERDKNSNRDKDKPKPGAAQRQ